MKGTATVYIDGKPAGFVHIDSMMPPGEPNLEAISALGPIECSMKIEPCELAAWEEFVVQCQAPAGVYRSTAMKCRQGGGHHRLIRVLWELLSGRQPDRFWALYLRWRGGCRLPRGMQRKARKDKHHEKV